MTDTRAQLEHRIRVCGVGVRLLLDSPSLREITDAAVEQSEAFIRQIAEARKQLMQTARD